MSEYKYIVIGDVNPSTWELTDKLEEGYRIVKITATAAAVHYLLGKAPERPLTIQPSRVEDLDPDQPDDLKPTPIDLDDIPF